MKKFIAEESKNFKVILISPPIHSSKAGSHVLERKRKYRRNLIHEV